ncbi:MAG: hypothetical protein ACJ73J_05780 [Actinomycetes bacterium]
MTNPSTSIDVSWGSMNVQNLRDLPREKVRICGRIASRLLDSCVCQEVAELEDDVDLEAGFDPVDWLHVHRRSENAHFHKRSVFRLAEPAELAPEWNRDGYREQGQIGLSSGLATVSPQRNVTYTVLRFLGNEAFTPVVVAGFHLVSGVYPAKDHYRERLAMRNQAFQRLQQFVGQCLASGYNVMWGADTNWRIMPRLHADQQWLVNNTIDKIAFVPARRANWTLAQISQERIPTPSDHDLFISRTRVTSNARYVAADSKRINPRFVELALTCGLQNYDTIAVQCVQADVPYYVACGFFEQRSNGANLWGSDAGGTFSRLPMAVSEELFAAFWWEITENGRNDNGVGPGQLTRGQVQQMLDEGLKPWAPNDNIGFSLRALRRIYDDPERGNGSWELAAAYYSGGSTPDHAYGAATITKIRTWKKRFAIR